MTGVWMIAAVLAAQQVGTISPGVIKAVEPGQANPLMCDPTGQPLGTSGIIVQGGREAIGPKQDDPRSPALAIGPKQDDPRSPLRLGVLARPGDDNDPKAMEQACAAAR